MEIRQLRLIDTLCLPENLPFEEYRAICPRLDRCECLLTNRPDQTRLPQYWDPNVMQITNISEAKSSLSSLIAQVEEGHTIIIGRSGKPVAMLVPYRVDTAPRELGGTWSGKIRMAATLSTWGSSPAASVMLFQARCLKKLFR